ncbi:MAG: immunity protein Imm33 domain-containing protein [Phycisphaerales bacterium]
MALGANVTSIEALSALRAAVLKFIMEADKSLIEADSEAQRVESWINHDQPIYWKVELRKREQAVAQAKDELRRIQLTIAEHKPSAVEQKKALKQAQLRVEEARKKIEVTRQWSRRFAQVMNEFRGQTQHLMSAIDGELPKAVAQLDRLSANLDAYLAVAAPEADPALTGERASSKRTATEPSGRSRRTQHDKDEQQVKIDQLRKRAERTHRVHDVDVVRVMPESELSEAAAVAQERDSTDATMESIASLGVDLHAPRPGDMIVFEPGIATASVIFLARVSAEPGDSGWYIGNADTHRPPARRLGMTASKFTLTVPHLRNVLTLPVGLCVLMQGDQLKSIDDAEGNRIWPRE